LIALSLFVNWERYSGRHGNMLGFVDFFDVDHEQSLPTFFSVALLLSAAALLACIAVVKQRRCDHFATHWRWLSIGFVLLGADEVAGIHEKFGPLTRWLLKSYPLLPHSWTMVGILASGTVAALYWRFLRHLPYPVRRQVVAAGAIFLGGAIGMELVGGLYARVNGLDFTWSFYSAIEEGMEMAGVILFIDVLLVYYAALGESVRLEVAPAAAESADVLVPAPHPAASSVRV
jgi:hypothetical protein